MEAEMDKIEKAKVLFESLESRRADCFEVALRNFKIQTNMAEITA
jgi:hypothetical protein